MSLVELLLDRGADPGLRDTDGEPAHSPEGNQQEGIRVQIHFLSGLRILDDPELFFFCSGSNPRTEPIMNTSE